LQKEVTWDAETKQAVISDETVTVKLSAGNRVMIKEIYNPLTEDVTTEEVLIEEAAINISGHILIPIRAVIEAFGAAVIWENDTRTILIVAGVC